MARGAWSDFVPPGMTPTQAMLRPLFGAQVGWEPGRACPHHGALPRGTQLCCMVCHKTGAHMEQVAARHDLGPRPEEAKADKPKKTYAERRHGKRAASPAA